MEQKIDNWNSELGERSAADILEWAASEFGPGEIAVATSFGAEDQVLTDLISRGNSPISLFSLDTGRLPQETYDVMAQTIERYDCHIEVLFPERAGVEQMVGEKGPNSFYASIENRKECCGIRKVEPLRRKLSTLKAWVTGLRREQSVTRSELGVVEWDQSNGLIKINPLALWSEEDIWEYIKAQSVPYNALHDRGYPSIGCAPCTRASKAGEDVRAGRWWWEQAETKECGLHWKDGKLVRASV